MKKMLMILLAAACGEGGIHQRGVLGDGEGGGSGDEAEGKLLNKNQISLEVRNER